MLRVFGHYVPAPVVALAAGEAGLVFGSVFIGLALPLVGVQAIRPASGDAFEARVSTRSWRRATSSSASARAVVS